MQQTFRRALVLWLGLIVTSTVGAQTKVVTFGVYTSDRPSTMFKKFNPFLTGMQKAMNGERQKRKIVLQLKIFKSYDAALTALVEDKVDFVRFGAAPYVLAHQRNPKVQLLAVENKGGKKSFHGMIVVRQDSPLRGIKDLRGKTFAFGDSNSTIGRYLAQDVLTSNNVTAQELKRFEFLGRHDKVFRAVQVGDFHAGSVKSGTFNKLNKKFAKLGATHTLRALHRFEAPTKPWVARGGMDATTFKQLRTALLGMKNPTVLKSLKVDGFFAASPARFDDLRKRMTAALRFQPPKAEPAPAKPAPPTPGK